MAKYFRFIGFVELLGFIVGEIILIVNAMNPPGGTTGWIFWIILIPSTVFGPAVGLLFLAVGSLLENSQHPAQSASVMSSSSPSTTKGTSFSSVYFGDESIEKIKRIVAIESSKKFTKEEIEKMNEMAEKELDALYEQTFSDSTKPIVKELSEISIQNDMIKIGDISFNLEVVDIIDYEMKPTYISFKMYSSLYLILYSNPSEAHEFYGLIKESIKSK